jgi:hypothetical protein
MYKVFDDGLDLVKSIDPLMKATPVGGITPGGYKRVSDKVYVKQGKTGSGGKQVAGKKQDKKEKSQESNPAKWRMAVKKLSGGTSFKIGESGIQKKDVMDLIQKKAAVLDAKTNRVSPGSNKAHLDDAMDFIAEVAEYEESPTEGAPLRRSEGLDELVEFLEKATPVGGITPGGYKKIADGKYVKQGKGGKGKVSMAYMGMDNTETFKVVANEGEFKKFKESMSSTLDALKSGSVSPEKAKEVYSTLRSSLQGIQSAGKNIQGAIAHAGKTAPSNTAVQSAQAPLQAARKRFNELTKIVNNVLDTSANVAAKKGGGASGGSGFKATGEKVTAPSKVDNSTAMSKKLSDHKNRAAFYAKQKGKTMYIHEVTSSKYPDQVGNYVVTDKVIDSDSHNAVSAVDPQGNVLSQGKVEKSMDAFDTLEAFAKSGLPQGQPKMKQEKSQTQGASADGGSLENTPGGSGSHDTGKGPGQGKDGQVTTDQPVKLEMLSEDDAAIDKQMTEHKKPIETIKKAIHQKELVAKEQAIYERAMRKAMPEIDLGGVEQWQQQKEVLSADEQAARLAKSDGFYEFEPSMSTPASMLESAVLCKSCKTSYPKMLSACPQCNCGAVQHRPLPGQNSYISAVGDFQLEKSREPLIRRPQPVEDIEIK